MEFRKVKITNGNVIEIINGWGERVAVMDENNFTIYPIMPWTSADTARVSRSVRWNCVVDKF